LLSIEALKTLVISKPQFKGYFPTGRTNSELEREAWQRLRMFAQYLKREGDGFGFNNAT
jgi:hypothetical protein